MMSTLEYDGITVPTPRSTEVLNGSRWIASSCCGVTSVTPWSILYAPVVDDPYVVPPSPTKCFAVASTWLFWSSWLPSALPCMPVITVAIAFTRAGSSLKPSYARPQRSSRTTQTQGAKSHGMPVARTSVAVSSPARRDSSGSRVAPMPMLCGRSVAPITLLCPCTASTP